MERIASLIIFSALLATSACADLTLGSITDVKYQALEKGAIGEFKASFFNLGDQTIDIELALSYPSDMRVEAFPKKLSISPATKDTSVCDECEYFIMNDGKTYVRTHPVYVYVKVPDDISRNLYEIKLTATARNRDDSGASGIKQSIAQVREISFQAYVPGSVTKETASTSTKTNKSTTNETSNEKWWLEQTLEVRDTNNGTSGGAIPSGYTGPEQDDELPTTTRATNTGTQGETATGNKLIETDESGNTKINLPIGNVILSKEESGAAMDIGIVTLALSVISLLVRILKT